MPTGYTAKLMSEGEDFRTFVLTCARAFGACIMQRDDPMDQPPSKHEPSDYHCKALEDTRQTLTRLHGMTRAEQIAYGNKLRSKSIADARASSRKAQEEDARLKQMAALVLEWIPPSTDHQELKNFMLNQIKISKNGDWVANVSKVEDKTAEEYFADSVASAERNITYHTKEHAKELGRTNSRNEWITKLYESLPR